MRILTSRNFDDLLTVEVDGAKTIEEARIAARREIDGTFTRGRKYEVTEHHLIRFTEVPQ